MAWYPLFAHARTIPEIFRELVRLWTNYTWLLCGEITKLDIRLAVWQLSLWFTRRWLPLSETQAVTRQGLRYNHRQFHRHCACSLNKRQSRSRWTVPNTVGSRRNTSLPSQIHLIASSYSASNVKSTFPIQQRTNLSALSKSSPFTCSALDKLETDVLRRYTVKINGS